MGAETQRERGASSALPPLYYLHVWWARRPLTPSRAAILASLLPADTDPEEFIRSLGIEKCVTYVNGKEWTLTGNLLNRIQKYEDGQEYLPVNQVVLRALDKEQQRREQNRDLIVELKAKDSAIQNDPVLKRWEEESQPLPGPWPEKGAELNVKRVMGDPAWAKIRIAWETAYNIRTNEDKYGYNRAFSHVFSSEKKDITVLDPTAGGGSIPFEGVRSGYNVIANELNPIANVILYGTLTYPLKFGINLIDEFKFWGEKLKNKLAQNFEDLFPPSKIPQEQINHLINQFDKLTYIEGFTNEILDGFLYCRQVICPHCQGDAPLLNSCWLSKEDGKQWGVRIIPDGKAKRGNVRFETYRPQNGQGPKGEDPNISTVSNAVGQCIHCRQAISGDEIKAQARGESRFGKWQDRLYCVVAIRHEPKLDKQGEPQRYASGDKAGQIKTQKIRFFRPPNEQDLQALQKADERLQEKWDEWVVKDYIPTEKIPSGHKTSEPLRYGMFRWCDMFTPRQLLGHCTLVEALNELKPEIIAELGEEKAQAVITYLQFAIDKGVDYNSRQTRWEYTRGVVKGNFGRHDFSLKWTFGEMIFTGPNSGLEWCLSQILDSYNGLAQLLNPVHEQNTANSDPLSVSITHQSANNMPQIEDSSVDLVVMDPPYYNNVQYAELSDYFYVWQKRTLKDLYPSLFSRRLTNKREEAVANPYRDGSARNANNAYVSHMASIFSECRRVLHESGMLTLMFTHKSQEAWEALTRSLIEAGWIISSTFPVESESAESMHQKEMAAAASSIFISCRKRITETDYPAVWTGLGGSGVQKDIEKAVKHGLEEFEPLRLNPVDEMVASYGRALKVLSENWPVMDGDEEVSPIRAMNEASRVVAENQISRISKGRIQVTELDSETAMALTAFGIWGLNEFAFDEGLNLSRSLQVQLAEKNGGYQVQPKTIGLNTAAQNRSKQSNNLNGYYAPMVKKGSKLRLVRPEEKNEKRLETPQTDWDILQGMLMAYEHGDILRVRPYLDKHTSGNRERIISLLQVWAAEVDDSDWRQKAEMILFGLQS